MEDGDRDQVELEEPPPTKVVCEEGKEDSGKEIDTKGIEPKLFGGPGRARDKVGRDPTLREQG